MKRFNKWLEENCQISFSIRKKVDPSFMNEGSTGDEHEFSDSYTEKHKPGSIPKNPKS